MTPTSELMTPKVSSGVAERAAVAITVDTTAPSAKPRRGTQQQQFPNRFGEQGQQVEKNNRQRAQEIHPVRMQARGQPGEQQIAGGYGTHLCGSHKPRLKVGGRKREHDGIDIERHAKRCREGQQQHRRERHRLPQRKSNTALHKFGV